MNILANSSGDDFFRHHSEWLLLITDDRYDTPAAFPRTRQDGEVLEHFERIRNHTALFLTFCETAPTEAGLRAFWAAHGDPDAEVSDVIFRSADEPPVYVFAKTRPDARTDVDKWLDSLAAMRRALGAWAAAKNVRPAEAAGAATEPMTPPANDASAPVADSRGGEGTAGSPACPQHSLDGALEQLKSRVTWETAERKVFLVVAAGETSSPAAPATRVPLPLPPDHLADSPLDLAAGDPATPALLLVQAEVNRWLPREVEYRTVFEPTARRLVAHPVPRNLLGAMWLQFATAVAAGSRYDRCPSCGGWFEVATKRWGRARGFCTSTCKARDYRERRQEAFVAFEAGDRDFAAIAARARTDVETVKGWLEAGGAREPTGKPRGRRKRKEGGG